MTKRNELLAQDPEERYWTRVDANAPDRRGKREFLTVGRCQYCKDFGYIDINIQACEGCEPLVAEEQDDRRSVPRPS